MAADASTNKIHVEVVYALPDKQLIIPLTVALGCTALLAVQQSGIVQTFPEIDLDAAVMGVWNVVLSGDDAPALRVLQAGDRVEIYRPLQMDPKESRRLRAEKALQKRTAHKP